MLSFFLRANAAFSMTTGLILTIAPSMTASWMGVQEAIWFRVVGIGLLAFSFLVAWQSNAQIPRWVSAIIQMDFAWVLGSLMLGIFNPWGFSGLGLWTMGGTAVIVLGFGIGQWLGFKRDLG
ncbi:hypothetical protein [Pontibacter sp. G13]|uniref:hypothetical protein n=1 Tax=Pontibacter sp. G13 TaxID=3074898 RepID=UPI00288B0E75|nr:hypothetical protein [Pontibacter sp. G13]WNJ18769.1 hypothetical protein RJD25_28265 [Pontibacter sp. G13]